MDKTGQANVSHTCALLSSYSQERDNYDFFSHFLRTYFSFENNRHSPSMSICSKIDSHPNSSVSYTFPIYFLSFSCRSYLSNESFCERVTGCLHKQNTWRFISRAFLLYDETVFYIYPFSLYTYINSYFDKLLLLWI